MPFGYDPRGALTPEDYLNDVAPACEYCGRPDNSVRLRLDAYAHELWCSTVRVRICDACDRERKSDI